MKQEILFICGPGKGKDDEEARRNIANAGNMALGLWDAGYPTICPHLNTIGFSGKISDEELLYEGYLRILEVCTLVVLLPRWETSKGARAEVKRAKELGIPIIYPPEQESEQEPEQGKEQI